jgi:hypothetical protein
MELKVNINKIHGEFISNFEKVEIKEESNKEFGNHFMISIINEGKEVKIVLTKREIEKQTFNWSYFSNPSLESSYLVERTSSINTITNDIKDIISKNRFDEDYLKNLNN